MGPERAQLDALDPADAGAFLSSIRCFLHYQAASDRNLLDIEAQEKLLAQPFTRATSNAEWMREYFRRSWVIFNAARRALDSFEKNAQLAGGKFSRLAVAIVEQRIHGLTRARAPAQSRAARQRSGGGVAAARIHRPARDPAGCRYRAAVESACGVFAAYCGQPRPMWATIESILVLPHAALAIRALQYTGLLTALFPEMASIADLVQPASEDRYTADEKTLMALERATELRFTADPARLRFSQLSSELENRAVLAFALLFHNTGQGSAGDGSVQSSGALARQAMERIRVPSEEQRDIDFLIEHQLDLAEVMSGRDVDDPATARHLAERVGTIEHLKLLTILTYSGLAAMNSDAMTPWRLERLWRVYEVTRRELTRELETDRIQEVPGNVPARPAFLKGFPVRYLRAHAAGEIEEHQRLFEESRPTGVAVQLDRIEGAFRLTVIARDMPALFASFAGAISSFGLDILESRGVFQRSRHHSGYFRVRRPAAHAGTQSA